MAGTYNWKTSFKRTMTKKRLKKDNVESQVLQPLELDYLEKILDLEFPLMNLKNDTAFWKLMSTNNDFNTSVVVTIAATNSACKVETFFLVI